MPGIVELHKDGQVLRVLAEQVAEFTAGGWHLDPPGVPEPRPRPDGGWPLVKGKEEILVRQAQVAEYEAMGWRVPGKVYAGGSP